MATILVMQSMNDYPSGLIGTIAALFAQTLAKSHGVDWTLDAMIAEQQCEFFRRFDSERDRVWVVMNEGTPKGALTIEGPRPESGGTTARLRFFILDPSLRNNGFGRLLVTEAIRFCRSKQYGSVFLTTLPGLNAAMRLYTESGFRLVGESAQTFHGSRFVELTLQFIIEY
jgi:GNAT superfamily N-acetyltransferase